MKQAAHFLRIPAVANTPSGDAVINALLELGYHVDLFAPGDISTERYDVRVRAHSVEYGKRWILRNAWSPRWRKYSVFSGNTEDPMSVVGILSWLHGRPCFTLADEIYSGSYRGDAPERWKRLCRWGMRRSSVTIVNDGSRIPLQREYAELSVRHPVIVYPGCFFQPPGQSRLQAPRLKAANRDSLPSAPTRPIAATSC